MPTLHTTESELDRALDFVAKVIHDELAIGYALKVVRQYSECIQISVSSPQLMSDTLVEVPVAVDNQALMGKAWINIRNRLIRQLTVTQNP